MVAVLHWCVCGALGGVPMDERVGNVVYSPVGGELGGPVDGPVGGADGGPVDGPFGWEEGGTRCRCVDKTKWAFIKQ